MILDDANGIRFELTVLGYEFPDLETEDYDSNWLIIQVIIKHPSGDWQREHPCLLTYELVEIADWLESTLTAKDRMPSIEFTEPNLAFESSRTDEGCRLTVFLEAEFRPDWAPFERKLDRSVNLSFELTEADLRAFIRSLRQQERKFPQRAER